MIGSRSMPEIHKAKTTQQSPVNLKSFFGNDRTRKLSIISNAYLV
jgi:hypothetical protein